MKEQLRSLRELRILPPKKNLLARRNFSEGGKLSSSSAKASDGQGGAAHFDFAQNEPPPFRIFAGLRLAEVASATQAGRLPRPALAGRNALCPSVALAKAVRTNSRILHQEIVYNKVNGFCDRNKLAH